MLSVLQQLVFSLTKTKMCIKDVKRTSNLQTSKFIFEFGILTFNIRVKFVLEQMWALKCLRTRQKNETRCLCSLPAVDARRRFTSRLPWPPAMLLVSDYPFRPRPTPLVLPSVSQSAQFDSSHASMAHKVVHFSTHRVFENVQDKMKWISTKCS